MPDEIVDIYYAIDEKIKDSSHLNEQFTLYLGVEQVAALKKYAYEHSLKQSVRECEEFAGYPVIQVKQKTYIRLAA